MHGAAAIDQDTELGREACSFGPDERIEDGRRVSGRVSATSHWVDTCGGTGQHIAACVSGRIGERDAGRHQVPDQRDDVPRS